MSGWQVYDYLQQAGFDGLSHSRESDGFCGTVVAQRVDLEYQRPSEVYRWTFGNDDIVKSRMPIWGDFHILVIEVENFLKRHLVEHDQVYPSEVADILGLSYEETLKIFDQLVKENKLKPR